MPRVTFSNELSDFVKGFTAGSAIADAAEDRKLKAEKNNIDRLEAEGKMKYYEAYANRNGSTGDETEPFINEGMTRFGANGQGAPAAAVPTGAAPDHLGSFGSAVARTLQFEGGKGVDTNGAKVNMGINAAANPGVDVEHLSRPQAIQLYKKNYWDAIGGDQLAQKNPALAHVAFDTAVNSGPAKAKELLQLSGGDPQKFLALREDFLNRLARSRPNEFGPDVQKAWSSRIAGLRSDIGARAFADGGAVPVEPQQEKPYYINDLMDDVGSALGKLGEVVHAGLQGLQEKFGLNERPAVADGDPDYQNRVSAFVRNDGAPPPEQVAEMRSKVDPENRLGAALGTTYGMVKAYDHYLAKGDVKAAQGVAASLLQYTRSQAQQLGALAVQALQSGDQTAAAKALAQAYNVMPNGKQATVEGNKVTISDERTGKVIEQKEFTPDMLMNAAMGMTNGSAYLNDLASFATSEKEKIAQGKNDTAVQVAGMKTGSAEKIAEGHDAARTNIAELRTRSAERIKRLAIDATSGENDKKIAAQKELKQMGIDSNAMLKQMGIDAAKATAEQKIEAAYKLREMIIDAHSDDTDKRLQARKDLKQMDIDADQLLQDDKQEGAIQLEGVKQKGRTELQGQRQQGAVDLEGVKQGGREALADKNNTSREGIAGANRDAAAQRQAVDLGFKGEQKAADRDVRLSEGEANRNNRTGIAAENRAVKQSEGAANRAGAMERTQMRTDASTANTQTRVDAAGARQDKNIAAQGARQDKALTAAGEKEQRGNAEYDRRQGAKAVSGRQSKEIDRVDKMTDHAILGADEAITPQVSKGQAQATRNIARSILEAGGDKYGDGAVSIARRLTAFDPATKRLKTDFRLSEGKDGYAVTLPDGSRVPINDNGYRALKEIQDRMGGRR